MRVCFVKNGWKVVTRWHHHFNRNVINHEKIKKEKNNKKSIQQVDWYVCVCVFINIYPYVLRFYWPIPRSHFRPAYVQVSRLYTFQPFRQSNWTKYVVLNPKKVSYLFWLTFRQLISAKVNWIEQQNWPTCATENVDIIYNASLTQLYFVCLLFNQIVHGRRHIPNFFSTCRPFPLFSIYCIYLGRDFTFVCRLSLWKTPMMNDEKVTCLHFFLYSLTSSIMSFTYFILSIRS